MTERTQYPALSLLERAGILLLVVAQFLFLEGPVWRTIFHWDRAIVLSYATIPLLVVLGLLARRRLAWVPALLHTLEIASVKFAITASVLVGVLATHRSALQAPGDDQTLPPAVGSVVRPKRIALQPPAERGSIHGRVLDTSGTPIANAEVVIVGGLEPFDFGSKTEPLEWTNSGRGFAPRGQTVRVGQPLLLRSGNAQLHTFRAERLDTRWVLNVPVNASGRQISFDEAKGVLDVRCTVHPHEPQSVLAVVNHPFHTVTDSAGELWLRDVPAVRVEVALITDDARILTQSIDVVAHSTQEIHFTP